MARYSLEDTFVRKFTSQIPDPEKDNVFRQWEFQGRFKLYAMDDETRNNLERIQKEHGYHGFLNEVMTDCTVLKPSDAELVDKSGTVITTTEWVKSHIIAQQDAVLAFWEVVNKGVEEKNSKRSRSR